MKSLFHNPCSIPSPEMYGSRSAISCSSETKAIDFIKSIFELHWGQHINIPLLVPKCAIYDDIGYDEVFLDSRGKMFVLPNEYRIAFAHFNVCYIKTLETSRYYSISNSTHTNCASMRHSRDFEAYLDIVNVPMLKYVPLYCAELIHVVNEIFDNASNVSNIHIRVNHTFMLRALLRFCEVPDESMTTVFSFLENVYGTVKLTPAIVRSHFSNVNICSKFDEFCEIIGTDDTFNRAKEYILLSVLSLMKPEVSS